MINCKRPQLYRLILFTLLVFLGKYFFYLLRGLWLSLILALGLVYLLHPLVRKLEQRGTPRVPAILLVYLALLIVGVSLALYGIPRMIVQLTVLLDTIPDYTLQVQSITDSLQDYYTRAGFPPGLKRILDERISWVEEYLLLLVRRLVEILIGLAGQLLNIFLAPVLAFYLLKDGACFRERLEDLLPRPWRPQILGLVEEINQVINSFIRGYFLVYIIVGTLTGAAMALLGLEFALMLGIFAGVAELIPYFGPVIGAIPAMALALLKFRWLAFKVVLAVFIIHQLEGNLISPRILGNRVGLHPLAVILALMVGGKLYGLVGMFLAVPVAAVLRIIFTFVSRSLLLSQ